MRYMRKKIYCSSWGRHIRNSYLLLRIYRMIVAGFLLRFWNGFKGK
ncbi:hypothetical protein LEP1GSC120_2967 [Leptospira santarosai str. 200702252]|nr:hypothetical protein LEP1GSC130_3879 [Leptospira santarosai str. 200403458]EMO99229.1 hypothetical protein LEP1GSC120_2967 [Leptospira santarosai str. 200702252]